MGQPPVIEPTTWQQRRKLRPVKVTHTPSLLITSPFFIHRQLLNGMVVAPLTPALRPPVRAARAYIRYVRYFLNVGTCVILPYETSYASL